MLMGSCAQPIPADPVARLDAAGDQLTAMNYAATTVQIAFNDFDSKLDNAQKARFDAWAVAITCRTDAGFAARRRLRYRAPAPRAERISGSRGSADRTRAGNRRG